MNRRRIAQFATAAIALLAASSFLADGRALRASEQPKKSTTSDSTEILVYGGTPSGIAAAWAAGKRGRRVILVEPYGHIGGLVTNGLSHTDFRTFEGLNGAYLEFSQRVLAHYRQKFGEDSPEAEGCFRGTHAEPHVNLHVFRQMLGELPEVRVLTRHRLKGVDVSKAKDGSLRSIRSATFVDQGDKPVTFEVRLFIDATYEGDLTAAAGVKYRVGREARGEYGESLAPEKADSQVQGYNFRLIMTRDPQNRVTPDPPPGYRREEFVDLLPLLDGKRVKTVFCRWSGGMYKAQTPTLPHGKYDINDVSRAPVRLSLPDINDAWPDGDARTRAQIFNEHLRHNVGMFYFLQNDDAVPESFREEARQWGWCKDEFVDNGHLPEQLYVREARRMVGQYVFTENDTDHADGDARAVLHTDAIAMGDYGPNCHGTAHEGPRFGGRHTGEFYKPVSPYQIPYGVLVPKECGNLLVSGAVSSSHVGFCALRLEPIWMSLGHAAGSAAHLALAEEVAVQEVDVATLQDLLHADGAATIYVSDVRPDSPDFAAVQWWGTVGGLHGLHPQPDKPGQRGKNLDGQYYEAFPGHAVELQRPLTKELAKSWRQLAAKLNLPVDKLAGATTRGEFIRTAHGLFK